MCELLSKKGFFSLDCDQIARQIVEPESSGLKELVNVFGNKILHDDGTLNRKKLRKILLNEQDAKKKIESILHPLIREEMNARIEQVLIKENKSSVLVEVPLLFESGIEDLFDICIVVTAPEKDLVDRICARDIVSREEALRMLNLQMSQEEKIKRADYLVVNGGSRMELSESVDNLFDEIQKEYLTS